MTSGFVPQRDDAGNEDYSVMRINLDYRVPDHALDGPPTLSDSMPRRRAKYPRVEGRDVIDFLQHLHVALGDHDWVTADKIAQDLDLPTVLTLLSWVRRASSNSSC